MRIGRPSDSMTPLEFIRALVEERGTQAAVARALGISPSHLGDILAGRRQISTALAERLGYHRLITYVPGHRT